MSELPPPATSDASVPAVGGELHSWQDFAQHAQGAFELAAQTGADLTLVDADFAHWPLSQPAVMLSWAQWATAHRRAQCKLLAQDWRPALQKQGAWLNWRTPWGHRVHCARVQTEDLPQWPGCLLLVHGHWAARLLEPSVGRGRWTCDRRVMREWLREVDVILQRSIIVTPQATLGL
jgi:hypothetical protein